MGKLLAWGDALFLVRCELGKLQIQRLTVDAKEKKVSLHPCSVEADRTAALPVNARLVAAKEVEDTELAVNVQNVSMDLLLSFNHVGHAYTGNFDGIHADASESPQVLLLNDVCGVIESSNYRVGNELDADKSVDDGQLVKRSVLIAQKPSATEVKLSCHRLRLREDSKSKHGSRSRKRSRNNEKSGGKSDPSRSKSEPFHYIERTQKASSRDVNLFDDESDDPASNLAASQALLGKLVSSLSARLNNGLLELKRLQVIVGDKYSLARQLNQLIARQWQKQQIRANQGKEHSLLTPLISGQETGNLPSESIELVDMETIVSAPNVTTIPRNAVKGKAVEHASVLQWMSASLGCK
ncbi:hypothetical protein AM588_10009841 [Phytophthora nicotianae]|uniref:Uncharacterized protein n=1 Tax=Phytophthora nicotianae TaxID=4792 RepID=A0A0W8DDT6_PHYNI|nr:hypothetical protein AM588_10009841 [Phytophthora nicotianae]